MLQCIVYEYNVRYVDNDTHPSFIFSLFHINLDENGSYFHILYFVVMHPFDLHGTLTYATIYVPWFAYNNISCNIRNIV